MIQFSLAEFLTIIISMSVVAASFYMLGISEGIRRERLK